MRPLLLASLVYWFAGPLQATQCPDNAQLMNHAFDSGAAWNVCVSFNDQHGLQLDNVEYQAPGDTSRNVLKHLHVAQILMHYHDQPQAQPLIETATTDNNTLSGLGAEALQNIDNRNCAGQTHTIPHQSNANVTAAQLCTQTRATGILAKYSIRPSLQAHQWQLFSVSEKEDHTWRIGVTFGEAGTITPYVTVSGRASRFSNDERFGVALDNSTNTDAQYASRATLLYTWRMVFDIDGTDDSSVEEFDFELNVVAGNRRAMTVKPLETEALRTVQRESFRGWRVRNTLGKGFYLDPQNSGYRYTDKVNNWAQFDVALSAYNACEMHALNNNTDYTNSATDTTGTTDTANTANTANEASTTNEAQTCGVSLDDFVNGESMANTTPVLWYSQSRLFHPSKEDFPAMSSIEARFDLIPFDWSPHSPFESELP